MMRIAVFGAGAWGTALAATFSAHHEVVLWARDPALIRTLTTTRTNQRYLPGVRLPDTLQYTSELASAAAGAALHLVVTPFAALATTVQALVTHRPGTPLIWACKGIDPLTGALAHELVEKHLGQTGTCGLLTGPTFADELVRNQPTAAVIAARDEAFAHHWVQCLHQPRFRLYANTDLIGTEIGGAVKNVMAIAAGVSDGLGFGLNARAALMTRGLAEMSRLGEALGARRETFMGLAGMGDLILTCTGDLSRNRRLGLALATGRRTADIVAELGHVAEGVGTATAVDLLARRLKIEMPISQAIAGLLEDRITPREAVESLLRRDPKHE